MNFNRSKSSCLHRSLIITLLLFIAPAFGVSPYFNNLAKTPPMGWNSWNCCGGSNETQVHAIADAIASNGMMAAGYQFVVIDDGWATARDSQGNIGVNATLFPSGIKSLADYVHSKGLKFGIYTSRGTTTCGGAPGSSGYEQQDANQYAAWGVDFVKADGCGSNENAPSVIAGALIATGRPIVLSVNTWNYDDGVDTVANMWRIRNDIGSNWASMINMVYYDVPLYPVAGPGHWNDADMLQVGNGTWPLTENKTHFAMWCMLASPLIAGNNLTTMTSDILSLLTHGELIAIDQDSLGNQAQLIAVHDSLEVWARVLKDSSRAVALLNKGPATMSIGFSLTQLGWQKGIVCRLHDVWNKIDIGTISDTFSDTVSSHATAVYRIFKGQDLQGPRILKVFNDTTANRIFVLFDEPVQSASAQTIANYSLTNGASITGAALQPDNRMVVLSTTTLTVGGSYSLSVSNVRDQSSNANLVASGSKAQFTVTARSTQKLTGAIIGAGSPFGNDSAVNYTAAVDGNLSTYSDMTSPIPLYTLYVGYDLGAGAQGMITGITYAPRNSLYAVRMIGMNVQGSNDSMKWSTLYTITTAPTAGSMTHQDFASTEPYRFIRLEGTAGFLNVAEIEFDGYEIGTTIVAVKPGHSIAVTKSAIDRIQLRSLAVRNSTAASTVVQVYDLRGSEIHANGAVDKALPFGVYVERVRTNIQP